MPKPRGVVWELEPHTRVKHIILQKYLEAWFPILSRYNGRVVYYDGFAGPGEYSGDLTPRTIPTIISYLSPWMTGGGA